MTAQDLRRKLEDFAAREKVRGKGWLSVALVGTDHAKNLGLPLDASQLVTKGGGQVVGLSSSRVHAILQRHGENRILAKETGRTSRGSLGNMGKYVALLNELASDGPVDLEFIERFWIERVRAFFAGSPFKLKFDRAKSLKSVIQGLLEDAKKRQQEGSGMQYVGALAQHLVGAKLRALFGKDTVAAESFSTSDEQSGRAGDFKIGNTAIHVTATPSEALIRKCIENLEQGLRPVVVTTRNKISTAEGLAENEGVGGRIDVFDLEQFIATNVYEHSRFDSKDANGELGKLVDAYNELIDEIETDPSLKIEKS